MSKVSRRSFLGGVMLALASPLPASLADAPVLVHRDDELIEGGRLNIQDIDDFVELTMKKFKAVKFRDISRELTAYDCMRAEGIQWKTQS